MESLVQLIFIRKKIVCKVFFFFLCVSVFCQVTSKQQQLKFPVWVLLDGIPNLEESDMNKDNPYNLATKRLKQTVPFILEGMVYGWNFSYTPYDKTRNVSEEFDFSAVNKIAYDDKLLSYSEMEVDEYKSKLSIWVTYDRTDEMFYLRKHWDSITFKKIEGKGTGLVSEGNKGLENAYKSAVLNAVRTYARSIIKNKPKEISGTVLMSEYPTVSIVSGRYTVKLHLYLRVNDVLFYSAF